MRRIFIFAVACVVGSLLVAACSSDDVSDSCTGIGGVCVAASSCDDNLPYSCNSGVCCAAPPAKPSPVSSGDASAD